MSAELTPEERFERDYTPALLSYLSRRGEAELRRGYELGREAVGGGLSLLDLVRAHHAVLADVLRSSDLAQVEGVSAGAAEFLVEVLAPFEMTPRE